MKFSCRVFSLIACIFIIALTAKIVQAQRYWIYFRDKGVPVDVAPLSADPARYALALSQVTERSLHRRAKVLPSDALVDEQDLPLYKPYEDSLKSLGIVPVNELRWFNSITADITAQQMQQLSNLPFVESIQPVKSLNFLSNDALENISENEYSIPFLRSSTSVLANDTLDDGISYNQLHQIQLVDLQQMGITGNGVILGMLDDGFRWRFHSATNTANVLKEYDFVFHDTITANQPGDDPNQDAHGTLTFSEICGYVPGVFLGGAFNSAFLLSKTEDVRSEKHIEEDNYAEALQWMDSLGVDITSSSLGYYIFDPAQGSYTYADMNGHTTICAQAVEHAAKLGIICVTAAGNEGAHAWTYIITPGDADTVITVGAVDTNGIIAGFSSRGPTSDGRIKPDVCALGVQTFGAGLADSSAYINANGTSCSAPLVASAVALILSAHPEITPRAIQESLHAHATLSNTPDTAYGWGITQALNTALSFGTIFSNPPRIIIDVASGNNKIFTAVKSFNGIANASAKIYYVINGSQIFNVLPLQHLGTSDFYSGVFPSIVSGDTVKYYITAADNSSRTATAPQNAPQSLFSFIAGDTSEFRVSPINVYNLPAPETVPTNFYLAPNYPNPFNGKTQISFGFPQTENVTIRAFNIIGQKVADIFSGNAFGDEEVYWDASSLPAGVYVIRLSSPSFNSELLTIHTR